MSERSRNTGHGRKARTTRTKAPRRRGPRMVQGELFTLANERVLAQGREPARARNTDPSPSHEAAAIVNAEDLPQRRQDVLACLRACGPATDETMLAFYKAHRVAREWLPQSDSGLRTRRKELVTAGLVRADGYAPNPRGHGARVTLWTAVWDITSP